MNHPADDKTLSTQVSHIIPNLFVVGTPKTGTTALCHYLNEHPNVFICHPKEPFYWCQDFPKSKSLHRMTSRENYLQLFEEADPNRHKVIGEGSTTYMQSRVAIQGLMEFNPQAKVIAMLRNPVDVAYAMHGELVRHFLEDERDFKKAWALQESRAEGQNLPKYDRMDHQLQFRDVVTYLPQVQRLFSLVPESQRRLIIFEDFASNTQQVYEELLDFLELPQDGRTEFPKIHAAKVFRNQLIGKLYHTPPKFLVPVVNRFKNWFWRAQGPAKKILSSMASKEKARPKLDPAFREELKGYFKDDVRAVSDLIGRDLTTWTES